MIGRVAAFIEEQRRLYAPSGRPLTATKREPLQLRFPAEVLDSTRFLRVPSLKDPVVRKNSVRQKTTPLSPL